MSSEDTDVVNVRFKNADLAVIYKYFRSAGQDHAVMSTLVKSSIEYLAESLITHHNCAPVGFEEAIEVLGHLRRQKSRARLLARRRGLIMGSVIDAELDQAAVQFNPAPPQHGGSSSHNHVESSNHVETESDPDPVDDLPDHIPMNQSDIDRIMQEVNKSREKEIKDYTKAPVMGAKPEGRNEDEE